MLQKFSLDPRVSQELRAQKKSIQLGLLCSGFSALLAAAMVPFIKFVVQAVEAKDATRLVQLSFAVIALFFVKYFFTRGQVFFLSKAATRLTSSLRIRLFQKIQRLPISYFHEKRAGAIQSVLTNDVNVYLSAVNVVRDSIDGPIKIICGVFMIFWLQPVLAAGAIVILPVIVMVIQRNSKKMRVAQMKVQQDLSNMSGMMQESLQGTRVIKAFAIEQETSDRFAQFVERSYESQMGAARRVATLKPMVELIGAVGIAVVLLLCAYLIQNLGLKNDVLTSFLFSLDLINQGAKNMGSLTQTNAQVTAAADRIYREVFDVEEPLADIKDAKTLATSNGRIEFKNVSFTYPDGTEALDNISFTIEPGESLALVGPSGSGKSTISDLILRFYDPSAGQILYDGTDLRELKTEWLRGQISVVPQQTFLFAGTLEDNIKLGAKSANHEDVLEACTHAHASFIETLPEKLQTEVGERGVRLSGGEAQRISIARAFIRKPKVLILDEATSNLDPISERAVSEALEDIMQGRTTLLIAHRLSTAVRATKIVMLRRGEVLEIGSFEQLMQQNGAFAAMYRAYSQAGAEELEAVLEG